MSWILLGRSTSISEVPLPAFDLPDGVLGEGHFQVVGSAVRSGSECRLRSDDRTGGPTTSTTP